MEKDCRYLIQKDIPLNDGKSIKKGSEVYRTHGCYYLNGGLQPKEYQEDFAMLVSHEEKNGWNYLVPLVTTETRYKQ